MKEQAADIIKQCTPTSLEEERGHVSERRQLLKSARVARTLHLHELAWMSS